VLPALYPGRDPTSRRSVEQAANGSGGQAENQGIKIWVQFGPIAAKNQRTRGKTTQNQAKRINRLIDRAEFRDQGVGRSNPLSPTIFFQANQRITAPAKQTQTIRAHLGPLNICSTFSTALRASAGTECLNAMASAEANDGVAS